MDAGQRYCAGCLRTLAEIARWGEMSDAERGLVMAELAARQADRQNPLDGIPSFAVPVA